VQAKEGGGCIGMFTATPEAARISRAAHFAGIPIPATIRFSVGSGNPFVSDKSVDDHGMAVKFHLPDGATTDIVARMVAAAQASTPEGFLAFFHAVAPDPATGQPNPAAVEALIKEHPDVQRFLELNAALKPIASYAQAIYSASHTFRFINAEGVTTLGRYRWLPEAGVATLTQAELQARDDNYLSDELRARLERGPVVFQLQLQLAEPGDDINDSTKDWPDTRRAVALGRLEITSLIESRPDLAESMVFDPTNFTDGIDASDDPVLAIRKAVYERAYARRMAAAQA
jgi:catalase